MFSQSAPAHRHTIHERVAAGEVTAQVFVLGFPEPWNFEARIYVNGEISDILYSDHYTKLVDDAAERVDELAEQLELDACPAPTYFH